MSESLRPSSQPHPSATLLGDGGDHYIPGQAVREPEKVLAAWFFLATETEAPEVRESLRSDVFPLVPRCQPYFQAWRNRKAVYDFYADDWVPPEWATVKGDDSSAAAAHRMLPSVLALRDWARRYREEIADRHAERNPGLEGPPTADTVSKAIRRTAAAIQLV